MHPEFGVPADRAMLVSLMKSGTHLIQELMVALGYGMYGSSRIEDEIRPKFDRDTKLRTARLVLGDEEFMKMRESTGEEFERAAEDAWGAYGWAWQLRLGLPLENRYGSDLVNRPLVRQALARTVDTPFSQSPKGVCWVVPELDIKKIDGQFLQEFSKDDVPKIILMYRDPRDMLLSMVNFLCGKTAQGFGNYSEFQIFHSILVSLPTLEDKLRYALTDPAFPGVGDHERALWLLHHPRVCKVSFEELVGAKGGGSDEVQAQTVKRVTDFLGFDGAISETLTEKLFRRDSFSFFKGQIGSWREAFSDEIKELAAQRLGPAISLYGYE